MTASECTLVAVTTSWDDGNRFDLNLVETLHEYDLPRIFYIPSASASASTELRTRGLVAVHDYSWDRLVHRIEQVCAGAASQ